MIVSRRALLAAGSVAPLAASAAGGAPAQGPPAHPDLVRLLGRMTLEEKFGQLTLMNAAFTLPSHVSTNFGLARDQATERAEIEAGRLGGVFNGSGAAWARGLQDAAMRSRLRIPLLIGADVIHGFRTVFPVPLAEASAFDPDLARRTARAAAVEAAAAGIAWTFAPMVDVGRDQRWGRVVEGAGEDVLLNRRLAAARVRGFQGEDLAAPDSLLACAKHFAAYGAAEGGRDYAGADLSEATLRSVYLPPFKAAIEAGALTLMAAFNTINAVPCTGDRRLLTDILRGEWGFDGFVVSDWNGDLEMVNHGFVADAAGAAEAALKAGCDMSMKSNLYRDHGPELVAEGRVSVARLDEAVLRVLELKRRLGLFDNPYNRIDEAREVEILRAPRHDALALEAATKSMVLLKNEGGLLPLAPDRRIALIGPFAESGDVDGSWALFVPPKEGESLAAGLRRALGADGALMVVAGSEVEASLPGGIEAAVAAARAADVVLLAIGESSDMSGEARSRSEIVVPAAQQALAEAVAATGTPVVVLLRSGRALALTGAVRNAQAVLVTWFLGTRMAAAVADVVLGRASPSGRLPVSFPRGPGQQPFHYAQHPSGRPANEAEPNLFRMGYIDQGALPLYPFGHGLTYGDIRYGAPHVDRSVVGSGERVEVVVPLTNRGDREVVETVQVYATRPPGLASRPRKTLMDFQRLTLAAGATVEARFTLTHDDLGGADLADGHQIVPGVTRIWVGASAEDLQTLDVRVTA
jgi:beta-glucosidase